MPFTSRHVDSPGGSPFELAMYLPDNLESIKNPPIVVFLHGVGERGNDPNIILGGGLNVVVPELKIPGVVLFPQCADDHRAYYGDMERRFFRSIEYAVKEFGADPERVYVVGYSMGATSSLYLAIRNPDKIAGIASIAVGITWDSPNWPRNLPEDEDIRSLFKSMFVAEDRARFIARGVKSVPIWFLHGSLDDGCPVEEARLLTEELQKAGAEVRLTEFPELGHDSLLRGWCEPGLFDWLLEKRTAVPSSTDWKSV
jgi:Predicted peptidase